MADRLMFGILFALSFGRTPWCGYAVRQTPAGLHECPGKQSLQGAIHLSCHRVVSCSTRLGRRDHVYF